MPSNLPKGKHHFRACYSLYKKNKKKNLFLFLSGAVTQVVYTITSGGHSHATETAQLVPQD